MSSLPGLDRPPVLFAGEDKVAHLVLYSVLGAALARGRLRSGTGLAAGWVLLAGFLYAVSDELHQGFVPGRDPDLGDLAADTLGLLLGYTLISAFLHRRAASGEASTSR